MFIKCMKSNSYDVICYSDKDCDFRIQLPSVEEKQLKIEVNKAGKVSDKFVFKISNYLLTGICH